MDYRSDIDGLRSIAILSVLFFHLGFQQFSGGFVGVDVFFVISGFLITCIIKKEIENSGTFNIKNFYLRRVRRIFPALFVTLFLTILFAILVFSPTHLSRTGAALTSAIFSVSNFFFWFEADYFDVSAKLKPLLHTWSLSIEEQFYFFWPLLLLVLMKIEKTLRPPFFLLLVGIFSLYLNMSFEDGYVGLISDYLPKAAEWINDGQATIFFLLPFRVFEFTIGAILVWLLHYKTKQWIYDVLFMIGLVLILYAVFTFNDKMLFPSYYGLVPTVGAGLLIYSGKESRLNSILTNPVAVSIGLISYSLYLIHWPIIVFWNYLAESINITAQLSIILLSTILAILSYKYIEQPFRTKQYDITKPQWKYSSIISVAMLAYLGLNIHHNKGWTWRIKSPIVFEKLENATNYNRIFWGGAGYKGKGFINTSNKRADIILIGDSNGNHYAEGLYQILAKKQKLSLYVSDCFSSIYLPGFIRKDKINYIKISSEALSKDLPYIHNGNTPVVIISESWLTQMSLSDIIDENGARLHTKITVDDIIEGIYKLKSLIGNSTLVVIGNIPGPKYNLYDIFSRPYPFFFSHFNPDKYIKVAPSPERIAFNQKLKESAEKSKKFIFLDPHDVLCKDGMCTNLDTQKHLIYSDKNHLSKFGSIEVIKGFLPELEAILEERERELKFKRNKENQS